MNRAKWIKQIIGKEAEALGFVYGISHRETGIVSYCYEHKGEEFEENIILDIHTAMPPIQDAGIRMSFRRIGMGTGNIEANDLLESNYIRDRRGFTLFNGEEEFKEVLEHLARIIREKGREAFDSMKPQSNDGYSRRETEWKLYQEHEQLNQKYRKLYGMEDTEFTAKLMRQIMRIIVENWDKEFGEVEELLIGLAAIYGDQLVRKCGGRWEWKEEIFPTCWVNGLHGGRNRGVIPLNVIMRYWRERSDNVNGLLGDFRKKPYDTVI